MLCLKAVDLKPLRDLQQFPSISGVSGRPSSQAFWSISGGQHSTEQLAALLQYALLQGVRWAAPDYHITRTELHLGVSRHTAVFTSRLKSATGLSAGWSRSVSCLSSDPVKGVFQIPCSAEGASCQQHEHNATGWASGPDPGRPLGCRSLEAVGRSSP